MDATVKQILFDKFEIISCVKKDKGTGVYIAHHIYLGKKIFLKTMDQNNIPDAATLKRFKREAKVLAQLDHPNIIKVFDFGTFDHFFYISFEYFESRNLRKILQENELSEKQKLDIFMRILKGLNYAHQNKIIHRDLKPENILIDNAGQVKIADFGLAQGLDESAITGKSSIVGTPGYMSPEQILGEKLTFQSDLFSLGVIAYELYVGENPFIGRDVGATINNILTFKVSSVYDSLTKVPTPLQEIIADLLKRLKKDRVKSAAEILQRLDEKEAEAAAPAKEEKTSAHKIRIAAVFVILAALVAAIALWPRQNKSQLSKLSKTPAQVSNKSMPDSGSSASPVGDEKYIKTQTKRQAKITTHESIPSEKSVEENLHIPGKVFVRCSPWAEVFIDSVKIDTTPLSDTLRVTAGLRELMLKHPDYPAYIKQILVEPMRTQIVAVNLDTLFGFLNCKIYPWGEIMIDGRGIGQSPFPRPICLNPGKHLITVKNPRYQDVVEYIQVGRMDTTEYELDFEQVVASKGGKKDSNN